MNLSRTFFTPPSKRVREAGETRAPQVGPGGSYAVKGGLVSQVPDWDALSAIQQGYLVNVVTYRCVQINAEKIASMAFRAGRAAPDPGETADFNTEAPLAKLLGPPPGGPNPDTAPSVLWTHSIAQYQITGRYGWEIEWNRNKVVALWPLIAQYLRPIPASLGEVVNKIPRYFTGYEYLVSGVTRKLAWENVYYDWRPSQYDWHQPESPLQAARLDVGAAVMQDLYDTAFLKNGGVPAYVVVTQAFAEMEERDGFRDQFRGEYGGPSKAGKVAFAEVEDGQAGNSFKIETIGMSARDAQSIEKYKHKLEMIAAAFGVPWSKISAAGRTYDNADAESLTWEKDTIVPLATRLQEALNIRLAPMVGNEVGWFDMTGLLCFQKKKQYSEVSPLDAVASGVISLNESRVAIGEDPIPGGEKILLLEQANAPVEEPKEEPDIKALVAAAVKELTPPKELPAAKREIKLPFKYIAGKEEAADKILRYLVGEHRPSVIDVTEPLSVAPLKRDAIVEEPDDEPDDYVSNGVIASFWLSPEQAQALAIEGYEAPEQMHVTLAYLGKIQDGINRQAAEQAIQAFSSSHAPVKATVKGIEHFETEDGIAVVALLDSPGLEVFRAELVEGLEDNGIEVSKTHAFRAHITLGYCESQDEADEIQTVPGYELSWNAITFAWGNEHKEFPLVNSRAKEAEELRSRKWHAIDAQARGIEKSWERTMAALIQRQERAVQANLTGKRGRKAHERALGGEAPDPSVIFDHLYWLGETASAARGLYSTVTAMAIGNVVADLGPLLNLDLDPNSRMIQGFIDSRASQLAAQVTDTTYKAIQDQLQQGIIRNESIAQISERLKGLVGLDTVQANALNNLRESLGQKVAAGTIPENVAKEMLQKKQEEMHRYRVARIADTETISSYNESVATLALMYPLETVPGKGWLSQRDGRVRIAHSRADGDVVERDKSFLVGGYLMRWPGDHSAPTHLTIRCRCVLELLTPEQFAIRKEQRSKPVFLRTSDVESQLMRSLLGVAQ